jgi:acetolactate synthase-1/2/3 large subunit
VVVLGVGAVVHAAALRRVLDGAGVPILCTYQAAGTVDGTGPDAAGLFTNAALERPLLDAADLVIGVGLDPVEPVPAAWQVDAPTVLVTQTPFDPAYFGGPTVVVGPPAEALGALLTACAADWPSSAGRQHREAVLAALDGDGSGRNVSGRAGRAGRARGGGLRPVDLVQGVRRLAGDAWLTVDAGAHMLAAMPFWPVSRPHGALISNGLSTMGYALPAAIGAALARRGERVVCLTGDGGIGIVLAELETLARHALPVIVVVFDDAALTLIALKQRSKQGGPAAVAYTPIDFAGIATAMGVPAASVDDAAGVESVLRGAGPGPFLLHARVDPTCYRHVMAVSRG